MNFEQELEPEHEELVTDAYLTEFGREIRKNIAIAQHYYGTPVYVLLRFEDSKDKLGEGYTTVVAAARSEKEIILMHKAGIFRRIKEFIWYKKDGSI